MTNQDLEEIRASIYRAATAAEYDAALADGRRAAADLLSHPDDYSPAGVSMGLRTALVCWRYSYYRGTPEALSGLDAIREAASQLRERLRGTPYEDEAEIGFACTSARVHRNRGEPQQALNDLESVKDRVASAKAAAQIALEKSCVARYGRDYRTAVDHCREAAIAIDSPHGRVALVHYFSAAACEAILAALPSFRAPWSERDFSELGAALAALRLLANRAALVHARAFPHQYAYIRKHEAMVHAFSGDERRATEAMTEASDLMQQLGSRKGRVLIAYSWTIVDMVLGKDASALSRCEGILSEAGNDHYYPPVVARSEEVARWISGGRAPVPASPDSGGLLEYIAAYAPRFVEILYQASVDAETRQWIRDLSISLAGDKLVADSLAERTLASRDLMRKYWSIRSTSAWREEVLRVLVSEFDHDLAGGLVPGRKDFLQELVAYRRAGLSCESISRTLGVAPSDMERAERLLGTGASGDGN